MVVYRRKKFGLFRRNNSKQRSESTTRRFWSTVSKRGTHFDNSFLIDKCSCEIAYTLPYDIFKVSAISCNFNLRVSKTIWCYREIHSILFLAQDGSYRVKMSCREILNFESHLLFWFCVSQVLRAKYEFCVVLFEWGLMVLPVGKNDKY